MDKDYEKMKQKARKLYEAGLIDEAYEALQGVPLDDEVRELHRALRYDYEATGIVSKINPETEKFFKEMADRLGLPEKENNT
jgi:hypothetical protein